eukprot:3097283-Amphidinium_carterae.1
MERRVLQPCTVQRAPKEDTSRWPRGQTCHTAQKKLSLQMVAVDTMQWVAAKANCSRSSSH